MQKICFTPLNNLNIRNIIFDLGGVVLDIDYEKTLAAFKKLGVESLDSLFTLTSQVDLFNRLDCGTISANEFRCELQTLLNKDIPFAEIDRAWNALILNWDPKRLALLEQLRLNYRIFLLSNTNIIHSELYNKQLETLTGGHNLTHFFDKVYYSYELGMRKPDRRIFELVLEENNLKASETLFIDDTPHNIDSAVNIGLQSYLIKPKEGETITTLFG